MGRKYKSKKGGAGFHPGKKPLKSKKRGKSKYDREKRRKRWKNRRPSQHSSRFLNNLSITSNTRSAVKRDAYNNLELQRKTFIIHGHGEFMIDSISGERKMYNIPLGINIGTVVSCGISFIIPGHSGNHDSIKFIEDICQNKYKFAWPRARIIDELIFSNYKSNPRTSKNPRAPIFNAGIWMCDLRSRNSGPIKIYDLEAPNYMGVLASKRKLTLTEVVKYCLIQSQEPFDLIIATCYEPTIPRNISPNPNNISNMFASFKL